MAATLPKRFEPFVVPGGLKGQLSELPVARHPPAPARSRSATGILTLVSGGARKALYVKDGRVVFASSNLPNDRLGEILIREGKITVEEYEASIKAISKGKRQGKVLVEMGALSPEGPVGGRAVPGPGDRLQHLPVGRGPVPLRGVARCPRRSASRSTSTSWT